MRNNKKQLIVIMGIGIVVFAAAFAGISLTKNMGKSAKTINTESSISAI